MGKYRVMLECEQTEQYDFDEAVEAENPYDAQDIAEQLFFEDISPYSTGITHINLTYASVIEEES